jgi:hypothetical protein
MTEPEKDERNSQTQEYEHLSNSRPRMRSAPNCNTSEAGKKSRKTRNTTRNTLRCLLLPEVIPKCEIECFYPGSEDHETHKSPVSATGQQTPLSSSLDLLKFPLLSLTIFKRNSRFLIFFCNLIKNENYFYRSFKLRCWNLRWSHENWLFLRNKPI